MLHLLSRHRMGVHTPCLHLVVVLWILSIRRAPLRSHGANSSSMTPSSKRASLLALAAW